MDDLGRITIPSEIRNIIDQKNFKIELKDKNTIILKAINDQDEFIQSIKEVNLSGDPERSGTDFSTVKDYYGDEERTTIKLGRDITPKEIDELIRKGFEKCKQ